MKELNNSELLIASEEQMLVKLNCYKCFLRYYACYKIGKLLNRIIGILGFIRMSL